HSGAQLTDLILQLTSTLRRQRYRRPTMTNVTSAQAQEQLPGWTVVDGRLEISVRAADFTKAIEFVNRVADIAEGLNHHPDFDIRYNTIRIRVVSHDVGGRSEERRVGKECSGWRD